MALIKAHPSAGFTCCLCTGKQVKVTHVCIVEAGNDHYVHPRCDLHKKTTMGPVGAYKEVNVPIYVYEKLAEVIDPGAQKSLINYLLSMPPDLDAVEDPNVGF